MTQPELHLIVLWHNARSKEKEILDDIKNNLTVKAVYEIKWTPSLVAENFSRFYGVKLPPNSGKEKDVGTGPFLLVIVQDDKPEYEFMETSRGHEYINKNIFSLKLKYRSWVGGSRVHTTNTPKEMNHDATLLLGQNYQDLEKSLPARWDGKIQKLNRDISGAKGWKDLSELFYTLNATIDYLVLRNYEVLPENFKSDLHGDIDILTDDYQNLKFLVNAVPVFPEHFRVHHYTYVSKQKVFFDFRYLGDSYYCDEFEQDLLKNKVLNDKGIYIPSDEYYFYSLIYHALVHKKKIATDYYDKIGDLFVKLGLDKQYDIHKYDSPFDLYFQLLEKFMYNHHYTFGKPVDHSVFYSEKIVNVNPVREFLKEKFGITSVNPVQSQLTASNTNLFLTGTLQNKPIFLKVSKEKEIYKNEYRCTRDLYELDPEHFVKPWLWRENDDMSFVALEYIHGASLDQFMQTKPSAAAKAKLVEDLLQIFLDMKLSQLVHRDIRPANFMVIDGHLKLIDCQLAVPKKAYKEFRYLETVASWTGLGAQYAVKPGVWDDAYSLLKVLEFIGSEPSYQTDYERAYEVISDYIGHDRICHAQNLNAAPQKSLVVKLIVYKLKSRLSLTHERRKKYRLKYKAAKHSFRWFQKIKTPRGRRHIYILGFKVFSYKKRT